MNGRMRWTNEEAAFWKTPIRAGAAGLDAAKGSPPQFYLAHPSSPPRSPHHTMSLLTSILGFSAFGFGARCLQLGIQKRPIFEGKPRQPAHPLTSLSRLPWPCIRRDRFRHDRCRSIPLGQQTVRDSDGVRW